MFCITKEEKGKIEKEWGRNSFSLSKFTSWHGGKKVF